MPYKNKADYTPEEWAEHLKKVRESNKRKKENMTEEELVAYKEKIREYNKRYYEKAKEKIKQYGKKYFQENKNKRYERRAKWLENNPEKQKEYAEKYRVKHKNDISKKQKIYRNSKVKFKQYASKLTIDEEPIEDSDGYMMVRDYFTKEYFYPNRIEVMKRIYAINHLSQGENHLYSSKETKKACPVYRQNGDPYKKKQHAPARDPYWSKIVISRADGHCERCGKECDSLIAHHKVPVASCAMMAADVDNGMALCPECHREVHSTDGCRLHELAAEKRKTV